MLRNPIAQPMQYLGKVSRLASEEVTLQLIKSKCIPVLLYGLEACPLNKSDLHSLDFVINRFFFMKLFKTSNIETVSCQEYFSFALPSTLWAKRSPGSVLRFAIVDKT